MVRIHSVMMKCLPKDELKAGFYWRRSRSRSRKSASDVVKIENRSRKRIHKLDEIGVGRITTVPFSSDSALVGITESRAGILYRNFQAMIS